MKKHLIFSYSLALSALLLPSCSSTKDLELSSLTTKTVTTNPVGIIFQDDFNQTDRIPDTSKWTLCKKGASAWNKHMSESYDQVYVRDGKLVIIAEKVDGVYKAGGIQSLGKAEFQYGKVEVSARFTKTAKGGWPGIWMMPAKPIYSGWPACGEIDIMEQLNHDGFVYHTIHTYYKNTLGIQNPTPTKKAPYTKDQFNIYGVEWSPNSLIFKINGVTTLVYPNLHLVDESVKKQWPFDAPFYLILNYALGGVGTWPGSITDTQLPAKMEIDWVKVTSI